MKKILITGGAGFIGLSLAKKLASENFEVHLLNIKSMYVIRPFATVIAIFLLAGKREYVYT